MMKPFGIMLSAICAISSAVSVAQAQSAKLVPMSNAGACIVPDKKALTIEITSQRVEIPQESGIRSWFADPTVGVSAEFDITLTSPTGGGDQRTFPAASTVSIVGSRELDVARVLNQFAPIRQVNLEVKNSDGTSTPFASIDAQVFLVRKTGDSTVSKLADAIEAVGGSVPANPWAAGLQLYGNLAKQVLTIFSSGNDSDAKTPSAKISLDFAQTDSSCDGFLHDGVNVIAQEAVNGLTPRPGEQFLALSDLDNKCFYSTEGPDPDVKFSDKSNGTCPTTIPSNSQILGNPGLIFRAAGFDKQTPTPSPPLPAPKVALLGLNKNKIADFVTKNNLGLTDEEITAATRGALVATETLPAKTDATAWALRAIAKCKKVGIPANDCL